MRPGTLFITGTDTGVGKTVLTALLAQYLTEYDVRVAALKPICSGGRADARELYAALNGALALDEINPWHFRASVAPGLAARQESKPIRLSDVLTHVRAMRGRFDVLLVEGAGGLLSPLGENFNSRDLIIALRATPVVVCPNRLGAVNQVLLTLEALPSQARARARVVLVSASKPDASATSNPALMAKHFDKKRIIQLPWVGMRFELMRARKNLSARKAVEELVSSLQIFRKKIVAFPGRTGSNG